MIKLISLITCLLYTCLLTGCGDAATAVAVEPPDGEAYLLQPEFTSSELSPVSPADAGITYVVKTELLENESFSEDQVKLAAIHWELPVLQAVCSDGEILTEARTPAEEQALLVVNTFNGTFDSWRETGNGDMVRLAQKGYASQPEMFVQNGMYYQDEMTYTVYATDHLVSVLFSSYSYYGGAHPNFATMAWNYDLDDGAFLTPASIALDAPEFEAAVAAELIRQAELRAYEKGMEPGDLYWEEYGDILTDWTSYTVSFDQGGMTVSYAPYELSYYASGAHTFTLDAQFLEPYLSPYGRALLGLETDG